MKMTSDESFFDDDIEMDSPIRPSSRILRSSSVSSESNLTASTDVYPKYQSPARLEKQSVTQNSKASRSFQKIRLSVER